MRFLGEVHGAYEPVSSEHSKVTFDSFEENVKLASVLEVEAGGVGPRVVSGSESMTHVYVAGVGSTFPMASIAATSKVCVPCARPVNTAGDERQSTDWPSSVHSHGSLGSPGSVEEKVNAAEVLGLGFVGLLWMVVSGGTMTSHSNMPGISLFRPHWLTARTSKMYSPSIRFVYVCGDEQATQLTNIMPVRRHSKVAGCWAEENVNVCALTSLGSSGVVRSETSGLTACTHV